jgi:hypothetical protein
VVFTIATGTCASLDKPRDLPTNPIPAKADIRLKPLRVIRMEFCRSTFEIQMRKKWTPNHFHSAEPEKGSEIADDLRNQIIPEIRLDAVR